MHLERFPGAVAGGFGGAADKAARLDVVERRLLHLGDGRIGRQHEIEILAVGPLHHQVIAVGADDLAAHPLGLGLLGPGIGQQEAGYQHKRRCETHGDPRHWSLPAEAALLLSDPMIAEGG
jgi:hypothetical protein